MKVETKKDQSLKPTESLEPVRSCSGIEDWIRTFSPAHLDYKADQRQQGNREAKIAAHRSGVQGLACL